ncbi:MAG: AAA family ATPase [Akkermansiaceae bacterium]|nr:AAA family ATPase [Akkermansiaceae bacterium]
MKLTIEAFRGANIPCELKINANRDLTILYGENGSGKTTISDALEFLFYGVSGSLEEKSLDGKTRLPALVHAKRKPADLKVTWEESNQTRVAKLKGASAIHSGDLPETKLRTLRRNLVTSLIEETPAKRFERIRDFVELPALEREERVLGEFISNHKQRQQSQLESYTRTQDEVRTIYNDIFADAKNPPPLEQWIKETLENSVETVEEEIQILKDLDLQVSRLRDDFKPLSEAYEALEIAEERLKEENQKLAKAVAENTSGMAETIHVLERAAEYLENREPSCCPVCDTPMEGEELRDRVTGKLATLKEISAQGKIANAAKQKRDRCANGLEALQKTYFAIIVALLQAHKAASEQEEWAVHPLIPSLSVPTDATGLTKEWFALLREEAAQLRPLAEWVEEKLEALQKMITHRATLLRLARSQKEGMKEYATLDRLIKKAEAIREILRSERVRYADGMLASISADFAKIYEKIHPGEKLEQIRLYVHPDRKNSAMLSGALHGRDDVSPVAYLSESHLDTLGLALFLALEKKMDASNTLLFLDDAIASVDEAHMERLYEAILEEAAHFKHVLITSHYQPLRFKFKWGQLTKQNVDFVEMGSWTLEYGISFQKGCHSQIELLKRRVAEKDDSQAIAAKSGVILEYVFDFLTGIYRCKLPRLVAAGQGWTLHDYKEAIEGNRKLLDALIAEHMDEQGQVTKSIPLRPIFEGLFAQFSARNVFGAHFNTLAAHFDSLAESMRLGEAVLELMDALCDSDYQLPESNKNGSCWTNRGQRKTRRLHPLLPPQ